MEKPSLVIMAAGMGSRYGGLKQIDPIDSFGHIIMDFSIYDAVEAGFEKVVFIIKKEIEKEFKESIGDRISKLIKVEYAYQQLDALPQGYEVPETRVKPFGTGHAILCASEYIDGPFAVINADDYYGKKAFRYIYDFLTTHKDDEMYHYGMVGYILENTLTDNGHVSRGVCSVDENHFLKDIQERTHIERKGDATMCLLEDGKSWLELSKGSIVSMNLWGFSYSILKELKNGFTKFLDENLEKNPDKCEYFLPSVVSDLMKEHKADVQVLTTDDKWYGVTYQEDKEQVVASIQKLKEQGLYPMNLWENFSVR